jgi:hypothetical protein
MQPYPTLVDKNDAASDLSALSGDLVPSVVHLLETETTNKI